LVLKQMDFTVDEKQHMILIFSSFRQKIDAVPL